MRVGIFLAIFLVNLLNFLAWSESTTGRLGSIKNLDELQTFVSTIQNLSVPQDQLENASQIIANESTTYLWDILPVKVRYFLTNQLQVRKDLTKPSKNLSWSTLPQSVKATLMKQQEENSFTNLTLFDLGLVDDENKNRLARINIMSLIKNENVDLFMNITRILRPLKFDMLIQKNLLDSFYRNNDLNKQSKIKFFLKSKPPSERMWKPLQKYVTQYITLSKLDRSAQFALKAIGMKALAKYKLS